MGTIITSDELLRKAVLFISEQRKTSPQAKLHDLVDEAACRFNMSPRDSDTLYRILKDEQGHGNGTV